MSEDQTSPTPSSSARYDAASRLRLLSIKDIIPPSELASKVYGKDYIFLAHYVGSKTDFPTVLRDGFKSLACMAREPGASEGIKARFNAAQTATDFSNDPELIYTRPIIPGVPQWRVWQQSVVFAVDPRSVYTYNQEERTYGLSLEEGRRSHQGSERSFTVWAQLISKKKGNEYIHKDGSIRPYPLCFSTHDSLLPNFSTDHSLAHGFMTRESVFTRWQYPQGHLGLFGGTSRYEIRDDTRKEYLPEVLFGEEHIPPSLSVPHALAPDDLK